MRRFLPIFLAVVIFLGGAARADQTDPELDVLFARLQETNDQLEVYNITNYIWHIWRQSGDEVVDQLMNQAVEKMQSSDVDGAIDIFTEVINIAPGFAEGWNSRATAYYLIGEYQRSTEDVEQTLILEPRHFGALSGQGLIYIQLENHPAALKYMEQALKYHPHLQNVKDNIEMLKKKIKQDFT